MISPVSAEEFYEGFYETKPLIIKRNLNTFYDGWFSVEEVKKIIQAKELHYGKNIEICGFQAHKKKTQELKGKAEIDDVLKFYNQGCSIRMVLEFFYFTLLKYIVIKFL